MIGKGDGAALRSPSTRHSARCVQRSKLTSWSCGVLDGGMAQRRCVALSKYAPFCAARAAVEADLWSCGVSATGTGAKVLLLELWRACNRDGAAAHFLLSCGASAGGTAKKSYLRG